MSGTTTVTRRVGALTTATVVLGSLLVLGTAPAHAVTPTPGDWVVGNTDPVTPEDQRDPYGYDAVPAGPSGTLLAESRAVPSAVNGIVDRVRFGLLPSGADVEPTWVDPLPNLTASSPTIDADPFTGDAVAIATGLPSGTLAGPAATYVVEYVAETQTWSAPRLVPMPAGSTRTEVAIRDGVIHLAMVTTEGEAWQSPYLVDHTVAVKQWALGTDPATATTETLDEWSVDHSGFPLGTDDSFMLTMRLAAEPGGIIHLVWSKRTRDLWSYGPPYGPTPGDPRSVSWALMTAQWDTASWTDPEAVVASRHARNQRFFVVTDVGVPTVVIAADELVSPGTQGANYADATYSPSNRSVVLDGESELAPIPTTGFLLPTAENGWHGRVGMRVKADYVLTELYLPDASAPGGLRSVAPPTDLWDDDEVPTIGQGADGAVWGLARCAEPPDATCVAKWDPEAEGGATEWVDRRRVATSDAAGGAALFVPDDGAIDGVVLHAVTGQGTPSATRGRLYRAGAGEPGTGEPEEGLLPPLAPVGLTAKPRSAGVWLTWTPRPNPAVYAPATVTTVSVSPATPSGKTWFALPASAKTVSLGGLRNGTTYTFRVQAGSDAGASAFSSSVRAKPVGSPARPTKLKATKKSKGKTKLTWRVARSTTANPVTGYRIYVKGKLVKTLKSRTAKSWTHGGEKKGRKYTYSVYSYNSLGKSKTAAKVTKQRR